MVVIERFHCIKRHTQQPQDFSDSIPPLARCWLSGGQHWPKSPAHTFSFPMPFDAVSLKRSSDCSRRSLDVPKNVSTGLNWVELPMGRHDAVN